MWKWRNYYVAPTPEQLQRILRLTRFHDAIRLAQAQSPKYGEWWLRKWRSSSVIGERSPLEAVLADGLEALDVIERYLRAPR